MPGCSGTWQTAAEDAITASGYLYGGLNRCPYTDMVRTASHRDVIAPHVIQVKRAVGVRQQSAWHVDAATTDPTGR